MQLDPRAFNAFFGRIGQDVLWRRADRCPCVDPHSGASRPSCPLCNAQGTIWAPPEPATTAVTGMSTKREFAAFGTWESGDEILSIPSDSPLYACGERDRVLMIDSTEPFQAVLIRGETDRLLFTSLGIEIDRAFWIAPGGAEIIEGPIPTVDDSGTIVWQVDAGPPEGGQFSLRGRRHQEYYMVADLPKERAHFHGLPLPRLCQFRKFDLAAKGTIPS